MIRRGGEAACRYGPYCERAHPADAEVRAVLTAWWKRRRGRRAPDPNVVGTSTRTSSDPSSSDADADADAASPEPEPRWSVAGAGSANFRARDEGARSALTSSSSSGGEGGVFDATRTPGVEDDDDEDGSKEGFDGSKGPASTLERRDVCVARLLARLREKAPRSPYLSRFLAEPFFEASVLGDDRLRRLFEHKKSHKEVTEAYGAALRVRACVEAMRREDAFFSRRSRPHNTDAASSSGDDEDALVIFDACSGRGIGSVLLSFWFPTARVVMMDANGAMDLTHVRARPNLAFRRVDLHGESAAECIREEVERCLLGVKVKGGGAPFIGGAKTTTMNTPRPSTSGGGERRRRVRAVLVGTHLCGALSPRLIDLAFGLREIDAMVLCPCCIKGGLGSAARRAGKARGVDPYVVLCETLRALCDREAARRGCLLYTSPSPRDRG